MRRITTYALAISMVMPYQCLVAGESTPSVSAQTAVALANVELNSQGALQGQLVTGAGAAVQSTTITVKSGDNRFTVVTDDAGRFSVSGLSEGQCILTVGRDTYVCRIWTHGTAPPSALDSIALVQGDAGPTVRGQLGRNNILPPMTNGQLLGLGLLAGAVTAVVIAADDDSSN